MPPAETINWGVLRLMLLATLLLACNDDAVHKANGTQARNLTAEEAQRRLTAVELELKIFELDRKAGESNNPMQWDGQQLKRAEEAADTLRRIQSLQQERAALQKRLGVRPSEPVKAEPAEEDRRLQ
jgi:hypothetical protein